MCGICAIVGEKDVAQSLLTALNRLEYRGYDSCGMMLYDGCRPHLRKNVGDVQTVNSKERFLELKGNIGIAHTRWATHGGVSKTNSHPHASNNGNFTVVHNGIISNYLEIKQNLLKNGFTIHSETDTEVFANLLQQTHEENPEAGVEAAFTKTLGTVKGHYALAVFCTLEPGKIFAAREESPLVLGLAKDSVLAASDVNALIEHTRDLVTVKDGEYCVFDSVNWKVAKIRDRTPVPRKPEKVDWDLAQAEKGGFGHYMLKEIFDQPSTVKNVMTIPTSVLDPVVNQIERAERNYLVGVGTTYYVALAGSYLFSRYVSEYLPAVSSDEFGRLVSCDSNSHALFMSQSGETYDTRMAVKSANAAGAATSAIVNVTGSSISQDVNHCVYQLSGPEISVVSTKAALAQMIALYRLALSLAAKKGRITRTEVEKKEADLKTFANSLQDALNENSGLVSNLARKTKDFPNWLFVGRGIYYPIAMEAALKMKEVTYLHAEGIPAGFLKHGTLAMVDENLLSFFFMPGKNDPEAYKESMFALEEVKARNGKTIGFAAEDDKEAAEFFDYVIPLPRLPKELHPFFELIMAQLLSYYTALYLGRNIDRPRNLAKSVTVG